MSQNHNTKFFELKKLHEVCKNITSGGTPLRNNSEYFGGTIPWLKIGDLNNGEIFDSKEKITQKGLKKSSAKLFPVNTVLIAMYGATIGKTGILKCESSTNQAICGLECSDLLLPKYLHYFLKSQYHNIRKLAEGAAQPNINQTKIKQLDIKIPSLQTQKKIVEKLDFILRQIDVRKQIILDMSKTNQHLIHSLYDEIDGAVITTYFESDIIKKNSKYKLIQDVCILNPSKTELSNISENVEVSFVPMKSVDAVEGIIKTPEIRLFKDVKKGYTYFKENDVIFAKITPCMENGKIAICKNLNNDIGFGSTEFHVLRTKEDVLPEWIYFFVRQNKFRKDAEKVMSGSAGQQRVPISFIKNYEIPVPNIRIQKQIINDIRNSKYSTLRIHDNIEPLFIKFKKAEYSLGKLYGSILDMAFLGHLSK